MHRFQIQGLSAVAVWKKKVFKSITAKYKNPNPEFINAVRISIELHFVYVTTVHKKTYR